MYAVISHKGKQFRVLKGNFINIDKIKGKPDNTVEIKNILMYNDDKKIEIGTPYLKDIVVIAKIVEQSRAKKVIVFKKKRRKGYRRTQGHRQLFTKLLIEAIGPKGKTTETKKPKAIEKVKKEVKVTKTAVKKVTKKATAKTKVATPKKTIKTTSTKAKAKKES